MMFDMTELQRQLKKKDHGLSLRSDIQDWPPSGDGDEITTAKGGRISDLRRTHIDLRASGDLRMSKGTTESGMLLRFESDRRDKEEAETWVNEMLEEAGIEPIETLTDLSDGLTLAQARLFRYNCTPSLRVSSCAGGQARGLGPRPSPSRQEGHANGKANGFREHQ